MDSSKMRRMERIAALCGNPERSFRTVHVAGTKGKGTTAAMIAAGLSASGYKTGLYTSPHVYDFTERISVDGDCVSDGELGMQLERATEWLVGDDPATFFEAFTLAAFLHFREKSVQWAVIEAGTGGKHSATNIIEPECAVITSVGMDHVDILGPKQTDIAREKAGIARKGKPLVCPKFEETIARVVEKESVEIGARMRVVQELFKGNLKTPGEHQRLNAALAALVLDELEKDGKIRLDKQAALDAIGGVALPGRFEIVSEVPLAIFDGAHTPESCRFLADSYKEKFGDKGYGLIFACKSGKDAEGMLRFLLRGAEFVVFPDTGFSDFEHPSRLAEIAVRIRADVKAHTPGGIEESVDIATKRGGGVFLLITGSFYIGALIRRVIRVQ